jgi:uncharacterized LabA/DUF88 family protein
VESQEDTRERALIFIDFDNMLRMVRGTWDQRGPSIVEPWMIATCIRATVTATHRVANTFVFCDLFALAKYAVAEAQWCIIERAGIIPVQCTKLKRGGGQTKDTVDQRMADLMLSMVDWPEVTRIVLATHDSDFLPTVHRMQHEYAQEVTVLYTDVRSIRPFRGQCDVQPVRMITINEIQAFMDDREKNPQQEMPQLAMRHVAATALLHDAMRTVRMCTRRTDIDQELELPVLLSDYGERTLRGIGHEDAHALATALVHLGAVKSKTHPRVNTKSDFVRWAARTNGSG